MMVICEAGVSPDIQIQEAAFECLVKIVQFYYNKMPVYMTEALYGVTFLLFPLSYLFSLHTTKH